MANVLPKLLLHFGKVYQTSSTCSWHFCQNVWPNMVPNVCQRFDDVDESPNLALACGQTCGQQRCFIFANVFQAQGGTRTPIYTRKSLSAPNTALILGKLPPGILRRCYATKLLHTQWRTLAVAVVDLWKWAGHDGRTQRRKWVLAGAVP